MRKTKWMVAITGAVAIAGCMLNCNALTVAGVLANIVLSWKGDSYSEKIRKRQEDFERDFPVEEDEKGNKRRVIDGGDY